MAAPVRAFGIAEFTRAMRRLETVVPTEVDDLFAEVMEDDLLPEIRAATPEGDGRSGTPGRLRDSTTVVKARGRPSIENRRVYANTIHWGRIRRGYVRASRFVWDQVSGSRVLEEKVSAGLAALVDKYLP